MTTGFVGAAPIALSMAFSMARGARRYWLVSWGGWLDGEVYWSNCSEKRSTWASTGDVPFSVNADCIDLDRIGAEVRVRDGGFVIAKPRTGNPAAMVTLRRISPVMKAVGTSEL